MNKPIIGLGRLCSFDKQCEENVPCKRCLAIGRTKDDKAHFTPAQEAEIEKFLKENSDLMDALGGD